MANSYTVYKQNPNVVEQSYCADSVKPEINYRAAL